MPYLFDCHVTFLCDNQSSSNKFDIGNGLSARYEIGTGLQEAIAVECFYYILHLDFRHLVIVLALVF